MRPAHKQLERFGYSKGYRVSGTDHAIRDGRERLCAAGDIRGTEARRSVYGRRMESPANPDTNLSARYRESVMIADDQRCENALNYLSHTDEKAAQLKMDVAMLEDEITALKAAIFTREEGSVELRKAIAEQAPEVISAREKYYKALLEFEHVRNRRTTANAVIELWRSINANRRMGQIS